MKLRVAKVAFGTGAIVLSLSVIPSTVASASATTVVSTHVTSNAPITAGASRSECLTPNFDDTGLAALQAAVTSFDSLTDSTVTCVGAYINSTTTWSDWEDPWITQTQYGYTSWVAEAPQTRQLVLAANLIPSSLEDISDPLGWEQSCAAGDFNQYATALGDNLVAAGLQNSIIRLGAEMNGVWEVDFIGTTTQEQNLWAACFQNEVTALRQAPGENFLIDWDTNACKGAYPYANYYPGNSYVDILGLDLYDVDCTTPDSPVSFSQLTGEVFGLTDFEAFASSVGKPMSFPEWGLSTNPSGDDPAYIDGMASAVANGDFAFETYFDAGGGASSELGSDTPLSLDAYQDWFGASPPTAGSISGVVTATGGGGLAGICVEAFINGTGIASSATTAADGTYTIPGLATGSYGVRFVPGCGAGDFASQWYDGAASGTQSAPGSSVAVSASAVTGVDATMSTGSSISGVVTASGGGNLPGVCISAFPAGSSSSAGTPGVSANDGTYIVEGLLPGSYDVEFLAGPCGGNYVTQWYNGTSTGAPSVPQASAVNASLPVSGINAQMATGGSVVGTVTGAANGSDVANVCVSITSTGGESGGTITSSADGVYEVSGLAAGSYDVVADPTCGGTRTSSYASPQPPSGSIVVSPGGVLIDNIGLVQPRSIPDVITPTSAAPSSAVVGGATYSPSATATSGDTVEITLDSATTGCTLAAGVVSFTAVGVCLVDFNDPTIGSKDPYSSAVQVQQVIGVAATSGGGGGAPPTPPVAPPAPPVVPPVIPPVTQPVSVVSAPTPREVTYLGDVAVLSPKAKEVLTALVKKLSPGGSVTIIGYAWGDKPLARERAEVVAKFLAQLVSVHVTIKVVTTSTVAKVKVVTTKV